MNSTKLFNIGITLLIFALIFEPMIASSFCEREYRHFQSYQIDRTFEKMDLYEESGLDWKYYTDPFEDSEWRIYELNLEINKSTCKLRWMYFDLVILSAGIILMIISGIIKLVNRRKK